MMLSKNLEDEILIPPRFIVNVVFSHGLLDSFQSI